jgi:integral membrane sensor domain MASE1
MSAANVPSGSYPIWLRAALAGATYLVALLLSYYFGGGFDQEANIWLASGIAIGVLALSEPPRWPAYLIGIAIGAVTGNLLAGAHGISAIVYALEELVVAAPVAWLLRKLLGPVPRLDEVGKVWIFVGVGALGSAALSWIVAMLAYATLGLPSPAGQWRLWIVSGTVGTLVVTPLLFAWAGLRAKRSGGPTMADFALGGAFFLLMVTATFMVFRGDTAARFSGSVGFALTYLPLPFLVLGAIAWGARGATLATFVLAAITVLYSERGEGPFGGIEGFLGEGALEVQGYVAAAALLTLMVTALQGSRQRALREAAEWRVRYEAVIGANDQLLFELDPVSGRLDWAGDTLRLLGRAPEQINTLAAYLDRVHADDRDGLKNVFARLGRGVEARLYAGHRIAPPGEPEKQVRGEATAILDFDDTVHRVVGFLQPVRDPGAEGGTRARG